MVHCCPERTDAILDHNSSLPISPNNEGFPATYTFDLSVALNWTYWDKSRAKGTDCMTLFAVEALPAPIALLSGESFAFGENHV
jgi:hypothetical protein